MKHTILQNKRRNLAGLMIASVFALAACGGGGGGGDHGGGGGLASGTFTRIFSPGSAAGNQVPFGVNNFGDITSQVLYLPADVGGSGRITTLRYQKAITTAGPITCPNTTIRLGHSSVADLTNVTFANNFNVGTAVVVVSDATVSVPATDGTWFDIPLTTPFDYNGIDNLVVQVDRTTTCSGGVIFGVNRGTTFTNRRNYSGAVDVTPGTAQNDTTTAATVDASVPWMQFVFTGGETTLVPTVGAANSNSFPFNNNALAGRKIQMLYTAAELNGSGPVTGIGFPLQALSTAQEYTITVQLGHSTLSALTTTYAGNFSGAPVTVASGVVFKVPANVPAGAHVWLPLTGAFSYNGTDNLLLQIETTDNSAATGDILWLINTGFGQNVRLFGNLGAATGTVNDFYHYAKFRFHGGHIIKPSAGTGNNNAIFGGPFSTATLYTASDLGTAGSITSVSCRLFSPSTAASYANFRVVMGHSTVSALTTPATDFVSQNTVFNGTVDVPGGLLAGDWIDIPLTTPFAYDGTRNLIVWMGNGGAPSGTLTGQNCRGENNAPRYPGGIGLSTTGVGSATYDSGVVTWTTDLRMTIQK